MEFRWTKLTGLYILKCNTNGNSIQFNSIPFKFLDYLFEKSIHGVPICNFNCKQFSWTITPPTLNMLITKLAQFHRMTFILKCDLNRLIKQYTDSLKGSIVSCLDIYEAVIRFSWKLMGVFHGVKVIDFFFIFFCNFHNAFNFLTPLTHELEHKELKRFYDWINN